MSPARVVTPEARLVLREADVHADAASEDPDRWLERLAEREAADPFDLDTAPPVRALPARLAAGHHVLMLTLHRVATDAWSNTVLLEELAALYSAHTTGARPPQLPSAPQIADVARQPRHRLRHGQPQFQRRHRPHQQRDRPGGVTGTVPHERSAA
ncbi:hypothetical protein BJF83_11560 [Nocardiopsis sp. CNR-923]|uniref:condensation domain-containing protein n=1 Tax=Nocardiopsis sp. CNR-923 TaxID=1904965 RepID=UPI0009629B79|nr:condensation domain-containing protein [Nocardiopsis sp. CNR-923]OLT29377.1 hypothetical protein BJF83_11560 [Nocardiopsis sp. CNR-923]